MTTANQRFARVLVAALSSVVAFLALVGAQALWSGSSFLGVDAAGTVAGAWAGERDRIEAGEVSRGPFAASRDPYVGYRIASSLSSESMGMFLRTDHLGLRLRPGPPAVDGATRIAVLGDSVAFGLGVSDEETFAHHLEEWLALAMEPGRPRPVVQTVASPGWTLENSVAFFLDHYPGLRSDIVLFVPVDNDLDDPSAVNEYGLLSEVGSEVRDPRRPAVGLTSSYFFVDGVRRRIGSAGLRSASPGPMYMHLHGGVTPESTRRFEAAADRLYDLQGRLAEYGGRLVLAPLESTLFHERLLQFVRVRGAGIPVLEGMTHIRAEHRLDDNRHTNGVFNRAAAWRFAEFLLDEGWVPGGLRSALPPESELYRDNRRTPLGDEAFEAQLREVETLVTDAIGPRIDLEDGTGCKQVYGGIWPDGGVGISFLAALSDGGVARRLRLEVERPRLQTGVYPLELELEVNGVHAGTIQLASRGPETRVVHEVELPRAVAGEPFLDVLVVSSSWVQDTYEGVRRLHAYDFVSLELVR